MPLQQVVSCQIETLKTTFYLINNETIESNCKFSYFEQRFNDSDFFKPNPNQLININYIDKVLFEKPLVIVMKNNNHITVETNKTDILFQIIENI